MSQEERLLSALSHISIWFSLLGIIVPITIWVTQKEKSDYTAFQALQAIIFQVTTFFVIVIISMCFVFSFLGIFLSMVLSSGNEAFGGGLFGLSFVIQFLGIGFLTLTHLVFFLYGIIGAIMTFLGMDFRYFIIANRLKKR